MIRSVKTVAGKGRGKEPTHGPSRCSRTRTARKGRTVIASLKKRPAFSAGTRTDSSPASDCTRVRARAARFSAVLACPHSRCAYSPALSVCTGMSCT